MLDCDIYTSSGKHMVVGQVILTDQDLSLSLVSCTTVRLCWVAAAYPVEC